MYEKLETAYVPVVTITCTVLLVNNSERVRLSHIIEHTRRRQIHKGNTEIVASDRWEKDLGLLTNVDSYLHRF